MFNGSAGTWQRMRFWLNGGIELYVFIVGNQSTWHV